MFIGRRMIRRGIRRGVRRTFRRLTRGAIISMAMAGGVTLAAIAAKEGVTKEDAEEMMDDLVEEGVLKKEVRVGQTVYLPTEQAKPAQAAVAASPPPIAVTGETKFCRNCGAKIPSESKFCEKCGTQL